MAQPPTLNRVIPTSSEANTNSPTWKWQTLRKDLTKIHSVTAIQLRFAAVKSEYWGEQMRLYKKSGHVPDYREDQIALYASPLWQDFAADSPRSIVMAWSFLGGIYSDIQALVEKNKLKFKMYGPCQFIVGKHYDIRRNEYLIKLIVPPFRNIYRRDAGIPNEKYREWSMSGRNLAGNVWYRRKEYVSGDDCVATTKSEL